MRPGQHPNNKRMRGRNNGHNRGKGPNPLSRVHESNGPDVKIRGTIHHIIEKYMQLGRDAQASGDRVTAENYYQHAEHYFRMLVAAQQQISPHMVPSIRVDDQPFDEEAEDGDMLANAGEAEGGEGAPFAAQPQSGGEDERRERNDHQRFEGRGRGYGERNSYPPRVVQPAIETGEQPAAAFPERDEERAGQERMGQQERMGGQERMGQERMGQERPERAPRHERFRREDTRRDHRDNRNDNRNVERAAGEASEEAPHLNGGQSEGREPGLPSFLTRGRRRGRPAYRRHDGEQGDDTPSEAPAVEAAAEPKAETPIVE